MNIIGQIPDVQQQYPDTCAIKSQQIILNDFGVNVTEDQLVEYSYEHGWYQGDGSGTAMEDVGKLLADAGIPCTQQVDANIYDLANELAQGHKVIVGVDSGELWDKGILQWLKDIFLGDTPDHALIVAGIDLTDPDNPMVILTDPGTGQVAQPYPLDDFMDAWGDSQNFMVSTDIPSPSMLDTFIANGMTDMHIPEVAGVDYNTFLDFQSYSHQIDPMLLPELNMAFHDYAAMGMPDFNTAIETVGLPVLDTTWPMTDFQSFDPMTFDYLSLNDLGWIDDTSSYNQEMSEIDQNAYDKLSDLHQDALDHAQQCMDDGMYISAQLWQNQANDIQHDMDDIMGF